MKFLNSTCISVVSVKFYLTRHTVSSVFTEFNFPSRWFLPAVNNKSQNCAENKNDIGMQYLILFSSISSILNSMFVRFTVRPVWVVYPLYELDIFPVIYGKRRENQSINPSHTGSNRSRSTSWVLTINFVKSCQFISNFWWIGWKNTPHLWKVSKCLNFFFNL